MTRSFTVTVFGDDVGLVADDLRAQVLNLADAEARMEQVSVEVTETS